MKTGIVTALLLLGVLSPMTIAAAGPVEDAAALATLVANCLGVGPDGQPDHIGNVWVNVDVLYQRPYNACA